MLFFFLCELLSYSICVHARNYALCYFWWRSRQFALQIAQDNHDAVRAMDEQEETERKKKSARADAAASAAYEKVLEAKVIVPVQASNSGTSSNTETQLV